MLEFIRRLIRKNEKQVVTIKLGDVREWFDKETLPETEELRAQLKEIVAEVQRLCEKANELLLLLENAKLKNPDIPQRAKDVMEGNRKTYIKRYREFLSHIKTTCDPDEVEERLNDFLRMLRELEESTGRSYFVLQEFFSHESKQVAMTIKSIESCFRKQKEAVDKSNYNAIKEVHEVMKRYNDTAIAKQKLRATITRALDEQKAVSLQHQEALQKLAELKKSPDFAKYSDSVSKKEALERSLIEGRKQLTELFLGIEPALRKQANIDKTANRYIENPYEALCNDTDLKIVGILDELKSQVESNTEMLNEKRKERFMNSYGRLTRDYLESFCRKAVKNELELRNLNDEITRNTSMQDYNELDYRIKHLEKKIEAMESDISELKKTEESISINEIRERLRSALSDATKKEVHFI